MADLSWKEDGKCVDMDVDIFFEKYEDDIGLRAVIDRMCSICPIAQECLQWGISHKSGVSGAASILRMARSQMSLTSTRHMRSGKNFCYN